MKKAISYLFYFKALVWVALAFSYFGRYISPNADVVYWVVAILLFVNGLAYAVCGYLLRRRERWIFWLSLCLVAANVLLTIFDQIGWIDLVSLVTDLSLIVLLFWYRKEWVPSK